MASIKKYKLSWKWKDFKFVDFIPNNFQKVCIQFRIININIYLKYLL